MIALAGLLVLVAAALLVGGLGNGQTGLLWASVAVSAVAAGLLIVQSVRRSRARSADEDDSDDDELVRAIREVAPAKATTGSSTRAESGAGREPVMEPGHASATRPVAAAGSVPVGTAAAVPVAEAVGATASAAAGPRESVASATAAAPTAAAPTDAAPTDAAPTDATPPGGAAESEAPPAPVGPTASGPGSTADGEAAEPPVAALTAPGALPGGVGEAGGGGAAGGGQVDPPVWAAGAEPGDVPANHAAPDGPAQPVEPVVAVSVPAVPPPAAGPTTGSHSRPASSAIPVDGEPPEEIVEVTDLLMILDLIEEVVVVDEHPRYHLAGCMQTVGQEEIPLPLSEAREDGFTACGTCRPDRHLADAERRRRAAARA